MSHTLLDISQPQPTNQLPTSSSLQVSPVSKGTFYFAAARTLKALLTVKLITV